MNFEDEYDLNMYKNFVMINNCKDDKLLCIVNTSSFLNTLFLFTFFIMFAWFLTILYRFYTSYFIMKYLKNRKAIYMKNMSRFIKDINGLCRNHVNDIIRIKKKIIPKNVEKVNLNISLKNNVQLQKNNLSTYRKDKAYSKYTICFTFSSKSNIYVRLYWGVLLSELNDIISKKVELNKKYMNNENTIICIDNFKKFFRQNFTRIPNIKKFDTNSLLDKKKKDINIKDNSEIDFNSCLYKSRKSFFNSGNNITYVMYHDEKFCINSILKKIEKENEEVCEKNKKERFEMKKNNNISENEKKDDFDFEFDNIRIPLIILCNDISEDEYNKNINEYSLNLNDNINDECHNSKYITTNVSNSENERFIIDENAINSNKDLNNYIRSNINRKKKNNVKYKKSTYNCNTLLALVDFKKIKDKYKPFIIKDICILNQKDPNKYKKNYEFFQFIDIMDIYGHEENDKECLICMTSYKDTLLIPCRHSSFCYDCMKSLRQEKCPICRCLFTSFIKFPLKNVEN